MDEVMKNVIIVVTCLILITCYSCKKDEEPKIRTIEYTVKGRITPIQGDSNFYWPKVWCDLFIRYNDYLSPPQSESEMFRADSLGFVELKYSVSEERAISYVFLRVHSDSLNTGFNHYCRIQPICNLDSTNFYVDLSWNFQGECE